MDAPEELRDFDWEPKRARAFGDQVLELWEELLTALPDAPVTPRYTQKEIDTAVRLDIPAAPMDGDALIAHLRDLVLERSMYPGHPRFMAYISGAGTVPGAAAELLAAALNQNVGGWRLSPAASSIETHLTSWFAAQFGLPESAGGILCSGGAMANFIALKAARDAKAGWDVRALGTAGGPPLAMYAGEEAHDVNDRAADMLGMGTGAVRRIPSKRDFTIDLDALIAAIDDDVRNGTKPVAVIASAGTVATGAVDPLPEIADLCRERDLWLHVDGAYGGPAVFAPALKPLLRGIERADSIAFDPHKWMYISHSAGCTLVRERQRLIDAFDLHPSYVAEDKERTGHGVDLLSLGPQFSRGFQALKIWVSLLAHGSDAYGARIAHDAELARYLYARAAERPEFEPAGPPPALSIACFRYVPPGVTDDAYLDALNERLMTELQLDGRAYVSNAVLHGRFVLRACIVNFRTEASDIDATLDVAAEIGARLHAELRPGPAR